MEVGVVSIPSSTVGFAAPEEPHEAAVVAEQIAGCCEHLPREIAFAFAEVLDAFKAGRSVAVSTLPSRLTIDEASAFLGVSTLTVNRMIEDGTLRYAPAAEGAALSSVDVINLAGRRPPALP